MLVRAYAEELFHSIDTEADQRAAVTRLLQYYLHSSFNPQVVFAPTGPLGRPGPVPLSGVPWPVRAVDHPRCRGGAREAFDRASEVLGSFQGGGPPHMCEQLDSLAEKLTR
ncbi:hypothetical protein [Actinoplanes derwentensis]|uniref:hypothetical protein n=1 Tax=Actinoplanes derwentensis TaxID=113562 RepID=UPI000B83653B|nr:hypothetical protein [Actinoplanes derwentensis]GID87717.1 hypothetical protein Ade03nite_66410 [Actinoplanes derwentensis]